MLDKPDLSISVEETFGFASSQEAPAFSEANEYVPEADSAYCFHAETSKAILAGFSHNRRVLVQGLHGSGKSTHIEQIAARLNWPCVRINLDGHISRLDLIGRDHIVLKDGKQVSEFREGLLPWALQRPIALVLDELDAARPEVMFVLQRVLENDGKFTLLDQNRVITPHPYFRVFATSNTVGLGNNQGMYHGTMPINHAQMDRWNIVAKLNYLSPEEEKRVLLARMPAFANEKGNKTLDAMIAVANFTRNGFEAGDLSNLMSPRTVLFWAENTLILDDVVSAFKLAYLNKCDETETALVAEYYQRGFDQELPLSE